MHKLRKIILTPFVVVAFYLLGFSQEEINYATMDKLTYQLYLKGNWKELIKQGKIAINHGIDYYYLRMRLGIAYYESKKYMFAIPQFNNALNYDTSNPVTNEYLYYSYLFSGRSEDARLLSPNLPEELYNKLNLNHNKIFKSFDLGKGVFIYEDYSRYSSNTNIDQRVITKYDNTNFGLQHYVGNRIILNHEITLASTGFEINSYTSISPAGIHNQTVKQIQYYLGGNLNLGKGNSVFAAMHYLNITATGLYTTRRNLYDYKYNNFVGYASYNKAVSLLNLKLYGSFSNLDNNLQYQGGGAISFYPLANSNLYITGQFSRHYFIENTFSTGNNIVKIVAGAKLTKFLWLEGSFMNANIYKYNDNGAFVVYVGNDVMKQKREFVAYIPFMKNKLVFSLRYQMVQNQNTYQDASSNYLLTNYYFQSIIGGLIWKLNY